MLQETFIPEGKTTVVDSFTKIKIHNYSDERIRSSFPNSQKV